VRPSTISSWALLIWKGLESYGRDPRPLFEQAGLDPEKLRDPNARYPIASLTRVWKASAKAAADPAFGLTAARFLHPTTLHALGYACLASDSLKDAFERLVRYYHLVSTGIEARLEALPQSYRFAIKPIDEIQVAEEAVDAAMAVIVNACRVCAGSDFNPVRVVLQRQAPADRGAYSRLFRAPLEFDASESAIFLDKAIVEKHLPEANAELARANDKVVADYLERFQRGSMKQRVEIKLSEQLSSGHTSEEAIAVALHVSLRTLQRKLKEEGTNYKELLEQTRRHLATQYVRQSHLSVNEITFLLGFSEPANFSRAFKRWTGRSPSAFRASG
jgi:AraC-like DNA-binding protein